MTPAEQRGFVVGKQYIITGGYPDDHDFKPGTVVTFACDDESECPRFEGPNDAGDGYNYPSLSNIGQLGAPSNTVTFVAGVRTVTVDTTVIHVDRKLTQDEQDAITAIIQKGI